MFSNETSIAKPCERRNSASLGSNKINFCSNSAKPEAVKKLNNCDMSVPSERILEEKYVAHNSGEWNFEKTGKASSIQRNTEKSNQCFRLRQSKSLGLSQRTDSNNRKNNVENLRKIDFSTCCSNIPPNGYYTSSDEDDDDDLVSNDSNSVGNVAWGTRNTFRDISGCRLKSYFSSCSVQSCFGGGWQSSKKNCSKERPPATPSPDGLTRIPKKKKFRRILSKKRSPFRKDPSTTSEFCSSPFGSCRSSASQFTYFEGYISPSRRHPLDIHQRRISSTLRRSPASRSNNTIMMAPPPPQSSLSSTSSTSVIKICSLRSRVSSLYSSLGKNSNGQTSIERGASSAAKLGSVSRRFPFIGLSSLGSRLRADNTEASEEDDEFYSVIEGDFDPSFSPLIANANCYLQQQSPQIENNVNNKSTKNNNNNNISQQQQMMMMNNKPVVTISGSTSRDSMDDDSNFDHNRTISTTTTSASLDDNTTNNYPSSSMASSSSLLMISPKSRNSSNSSNNKEDNNNNNNNSTTTLPPFNSISRSNNNNNKNSNDTSCLKIIKCQCEHPAHCTVYDPSMPLFTNPSQSPGSYSECLTISQTLCGYWLTIVERSESLDAQYRLIGLGMVKRAVMNRLAVPLTMFLENDDSNLHCWIHTPLGIRHMNTNLLGEECIDEDPDAGRWIGRAKVVDYTIPWYCEGRSVRALQQTRFSSKVGKCVETRCVLPDKTEGKVMLFNFTMFPKGANESKKLSADRILRLAKTNEKEGGVEGS